MGNDTRLPCCHSERSGAKNLALDSSADRQQGGMLGGVYPECPLACGPAKEMRIAGVVTPAQSLP